MCTKTGRKYWNISRLVEWLGWPSKFNLWIDNTLSRMFRLDKKKKIDVKRLYLFMSSANSLKFHPSNRPSDFMVELSHTLNLLGRWERLLLNALAECRLRLLVILEKLFFGWRF